VSFWKSPGGTVGALGKPWLGEADAPGGVQYEFGTVCLTGSGTTLVRSLPTSNKKGE
jgi:hypothetical protein